MSRTKNNTFTFKDWINDKGIDKVSRILKVDPSTVRHWRLGNGYPRVEQMRVIKKLTKGAIGYDQIIDGISATKSSAGNR